MVRPTNKVKGQALIEFVVYLAIFLIGIFVAQEIITEARKETKRFDKVGKWRNHGRN